MKPLRAKPMALKPIGLRPMALRPLGYDDYDRANYLIKNGLLQPGASLLRTGSVLLENGSVFGPNVGVCDGGRYIHHGTLTNRIIWSDDFTLWSANGADDISGPIPAPYGSGLMWAINKSVAPTQFVSRRYPFAYSIGSSYEISIIAKRKDFDYLILRQLANAANGRAWFNLATGVVGTAQSGIKSHSIKSIGGGFYKCSIVFDTSAVIDFNLIDVSFSALDSTTESSGVGVGVYVWRARVTKTAYAIPYIDISTSGSIVTIDTAASDLSTLHGLTASIDDPRAAWLWGILDGGSGVVSYIDHAITPTLAQWRTTGGEMVLIAQSNGAPAFFIDQADGLYKIHDGVNTAVSPAPYVAGVAADIDIVLMGDTMRIDMNGVPGTPSPFGGTLIHGTDTIKFNCFVEDTVTQQHIYGRAA